LRNDYSADPKKRNLQVEAIAHVTVQGWIDQNGLTGRAVTIDAICEIHRRFGELLPPELLKIENPRPASCWMLSRGSSATGM